MNELIFTYSGEGSQYSWMAKELYEQHSVFRSCMLEGDELLRSFGYSSVLAYIYPPKRDLAPLDATERSHPALFLVQYALTQALAAEGVRPDRVLGYSLGELIAATVAGYFSFAEGLKLCAAQGALFAQHTPAAGMLAVLGPLRLHTEHSEVFQGTWLAGVNYDENFVIAGPNDELDRVASFLKQIKTIYARLPVSKGFHSPLIETARSEFFEVYATTAGTAPNGAIQFLPTLAAPSTNSKPDGEYFWRVAREPVLFHETIASLEGIGPLRYLDLSPSATLAGFLKRIIAPTSQSQVHALLSPFGGDLKRLKSIAAAI